MKTSGKKAKSETNELTQIFYKLKKKYAYSVYPSEREDLEQTIWYLMLLAMKKYNPKRGTLQNFAYYFADQKLKDHFWRRVNLPETKGNFTLLHLKAALIEDDEALPDKRMKKSIDLPYFLRLKAEGYNLSEIATKMNISYGTARRRWKKYVEEIKKSQVI